MYRRVKLLTMLYLLLMLFLSSCAANAKEKPENRTLCNPIDLNYRFQLDEPSRREAADPSVIRFKDDYFMFISKSGGYYKSRDLTSWEFITCDDLPFEDYAPTAVVMDGAVYFMALNQKIYKSTDPQSGHWQVVNDSLTIRAFDPMLFLDDDGRLYLYHGLSARAPLYGVELDRQTLQPIGEQADLLSTRHDIYGWERPGDYNTGSARRPWLEGAFVTKHNGKYYLQYSVPGTQFKSYADGMYVSENPLGPYTLAAHNPFSYKPEGFVAGAGHGSTFQDKYGNYWYAGTMSVSVLHRLERRVGMFPAFFDKDDCFYAYTGFGDYPHRVPQSRMNSYEDYQPTSMLLSYNKPVEVSSTLNGYKKEFAVNEDIRTCWSAQSGKQGEWLMVDLECEADVHAIQVNLADVDTKILGRPDGISSRYTIAYSLDKEHWTELIDKSSFSQDQPHNYTELPTAVKARYIKITNVAVADGKFALSGLRIFGFGNGQKPQEVKQITVERDFDDKCIARLSWEKQPRVTGYNVRYGTSPDKLYLNYIVYGAENVSVNSLNALQDYYFTVDAFNENGITTGKDVIHVSATAKQ